MVRHVVVVRMMGAVVVLVRMLPRMRALIVAVVRGMMSLRRRCRKMKIRVVVVVVLRSLRRKPILGADVVGKKRVLRMMWHLESILF
jgi:hypothetical protein